MFTVTNIATENTNAIPPAHSFPGMPKAANHGLQRCRGPRVPLTCLLTPRTDTYIVPALIADLGEQAGWRYVEFFTANIRNPHTRRAYARACSQFFALVRAARPDAHRDPAA